jgi:hypothetical protein
MKRKVLILSALFTLTDFVYGQNFTLAPTQIDISVAPAFNHEPVRISIVTNVPGLSVSNLVVSSDAAWVAPSVDPAASKLILSFATANLINQSYTATITASLGGQTNTLFVRAFVSPLNIFKLKDDPLRSRTYGIQQNGLAIGSVVVLDPVTTNYLGNITVGRKPSDLVESADGQELFVINCVDATLSVIDLSTLAVKETLVLPAFDNWGQNDTTANVAVGPGTVLYYTDGAWAPALRVLNRSTMQVLQTVYTQGAAGEGIGDVGLTSDKRLLYGWMQYGWSAGLANSYVVRFTVATNGLLTFAGQGDSQYNSMFARDPLEAPVLVSSDDQTIFIKGFAVGADSASNVKHTFPTAVYSITPGGEIAATATAMYETATGIKLADLPANTPVQTISSDYSRFIYFDSVTRSLKVLNLLDLIGPGILNRGVAPADGSITLSPGRLEWSPLPGVDRYNVYLGTLETAVANADTNSAAFLGTTTQPYFQLSSPLTPGTTYFWRVDAATQFDTTKGDVKEFTVSGISSSTSEINAATVQGHRDFKISFTLDSANPGVPWVASADQSWVSFTQTTGVTPATVEVVLDASILDTGLHQASLTISSGANASFSIPIQFNVEPLNLTVLKSDPGSPFVYAISEDTSATPARAYLLEINTVTESIRRVVRVGSSATDLAIHGGDNRLYVPNWLTGALLAIDKSSFQQIRSYTFSPFGGVGYSQDDVFRVAAGAPGRVVVEAEDQWIRISLFDTTAGSVLTSGFVREGGGAFGGNGRYYYHGDNNSSGAEIHKFDVTGDQFTELAHVRVAGYSYYGSRTVLASENGNRVFWNGGVFDADLRVEWTMADQICAASADGRFAFGTSSVYDIDQHSVIATLTPATPVKAFNSLTGKLVYKGSNGIAFYRLGSQEHVTPEDGSIAPSPLALAWQTVPVATSYDLYLGQSSQAVSTAGTNSPLFLGEVTSTSFALASSLPAGAYYWRVDAVTPYGTVVGAVHDFIVSSISPGLQQINEITFPGRPATTTLTLTSAVAGESWQATADASWISLSQTNGTTPATIQITLDASVDPPLIRTGSISLGGTGGKLFSIPVQLAVESLYLTVIKADPGSAKVYAISEDPARTPARAYLLEIDSSTERIERVVSVGSSATDLAIHNGDQRLYVPNWQTGALLAIDKDTFQQVRSYTFSPFGGVGYSQGDVYRVSAGAPGRVVVEEEDQWIDISLFDTSAGTVLANAFVREGGGAFGGTGRYYYHGDNNSSGAEIHKFDVLGDAFAALAHVRVESVNYYGSRTVVVSDDGSRVFWNGSMFDANLVELWTLRDEIFSSSADGHFAFSQTKIYDTGQQQAVLSMPVNTRVSAFNSTSRKLVVQTGTSLAFFELTDPLTLPTPVLSVSAITYASVALTWTDHSLEDSFTLQKRVAGSVAWEDVATLGANVAQYTVIGLAMQTSYEFRIKADAAAISSAWSDILTASTPGAPPSTPFLNAPVATTISVSLSWSNPADETDFVLERSVGTSGNWSVLATLAADATTYTDTNVVWLTPYFYRIKARNADGESAYSAVAGVTVPAPSAPSAPIGLVARPQSSSAVLVYWTDVSAETGYRLERRTESLNSWLTLVTVPANTTNYLDTNVVQGTQYYYRAQAFNEIGGSPYSNEAPAVPANIVNLLADDFDPTLDAGVWAAISGGVATNGGAGFRGNNALWFSAAGVRQAATVPVSGAAGSYVDFLIRAGNAAMDGNQFWNNSEPGEYVVVEYSTDGVQWSLLRSLNTVYPSLSTWTPFSIALPETAAGAHIQVRWRQLANSGPGYDSWALDDVRVAGAAPPAPTAPPFIISSPNSATSIAVYWIDVEGATSYVLERRQGTGLWIPLGTQPAARNYYTDTAVLPATAYSYRVQAINAGGASLFSAATTSVTWSQMEEWLLFNYGGIDALTTGAIYSVSPDGTRPLLRYAFNLSADEPARTLTPGVSTSGFPAIWFDASRDRLCVEFVRRKTATNPDIRYDVQFSSDLLDWSSAGSSGVEISSSSIDTIWERVRFEDASDAGQAPIRFCRVTVSPQ